MTRLAKFNSPEPAYQRRGGRWKSKNISKQLQAIQTVAPPEPRDDKKLCFCFWSKKHENCVFDQRNTKSCWKGTSRSLPWTSAITVSTWYLSVIMWNHNSWQFFYDYMYLHVTIWNYYDTSTLTNRNVKWKLFAYKWCNWIRWLVHLLLVKVCHQARGCVHLLPRQGVIPAHHHHHYQSVVLAHRQVHKKENFKRNNFLLKIPSDPNLPQSFCKLKGVEIQTN